MQVYAAIFAGDYAKQINVDLYLLIRKLVLYGVKDILNLNVMHAFKRIPTSMIRDVYSKVLDDVSL